MSIYNEKEVEKGKEKNSKEKNEKNQDQNNIKEFGVPNQADAKMIFNIYQLSVKSKDII